MRSELQALAEAVAGIDTRLERYREENAREHEETRGLLRLSQADLHRRLRIVEARA